LAAPSNGSSATKEISRGHQILISPSGLITIIGGKWTTYRKMAEDVIDKTISIGKLIKRSCITATLPIHGFTEAVNWDDALNAYGSDKKELLQLINENADYAEKLHPQYDFIKAQVIWAARYEMARTVEDVLARRVRLLFLDAHAAIESAPVVADLLANELKKDEAWKQLQVSAFIRLAKRYIIE
jgi:glycerol-3-phosphate dehydrogenase